MALNIIYKKTSALATEPKMATPGLTGCDLFAAENKIINPTSFDSEKSFYKWRYLKGTMEEYCLGPVSH